MRGRIVLLVPLVACGACGMLGGGGQPEPAAAAPETMAAPAVAPAPSPGATEPWSPADPPPRGAAAAAARTAPAATGANDPTATLYVRLGRIAAIRTVVDTFHTRIMADGRINAFFRGVDDARLRRLLSEQICQASGGPCEYTGRLMRIAHQGMNLTDAHFDALVEDLVAALDANGVAERERNELLAVLGPMRPQIVGQ